MADRIIANRPYLDEKDLMKVSGVGPALFDRIKPLISVAEEVKGEDEEIIYLGAETTIDDQPADLKTEPSEETTSEEGIPSWDGSDIEETEVIGVDEPTEDIKSVTAEREKREETISKEKAIIHVVEPASQRDSNGKKPRSITLGNALLMTAAFSFISFILAVLLSLGILSSLNNGLRYASTDQIQAIVRQVEVMNSEFGLLNEDINGLRSRLDNLESLGGRVGEIELETEQIANSLTALAEEYQGVVDQIADITNTAERFKIFLNGLGDLLDTLTEGQ
jgi:hypothetical protein